MKITKRTLITAFGCILLVLYVLVSVAWSRFRASEEKCTGLENGLVEVIDPDGIGFVTEQELTADLLASLPDSLTALNFTALNLSDIQQRLRAMPNIESAEVVRLSDDRMRVRVRPMKPVARIWPPKSRSYYVNREGKRMAASSKYRIDVPQVAGRFDSARSEVTLLPLLDYLSSNPDMGKIVTMIDASDTTNIILVPAMRGHVINLGRATSVGNKMSRLQTFYREVLPVKGWEHYDTISLKWDGQIVATRRHRKLPDLSVKIIDELENEADDLSTMSTKTDSINHKE